MAFTNDRKTRDGTENEGIRRRKVEVFFFLYI